MDYFEEVKFRVLDRPTAHTLSLVLCIKWLPMMRPFEWRLTGTWAMFAVPGAEEYVIALLPTSASMANQRVGSNTASALNMFLLRPGARANTTDWIYLFQIDLGLHVNVLERFLPNVRIEAIRRHRALVASLRRHFAGQVQAWLNDVEDDTPLRDQGRKQAFSRLRAFPGLNAEARRAEAVVAKRLAQRFVAGVRYASCTEMHYSPRNKPKRDPSPSSVFLCSALPLPFLLSSPPPGARPARATGKGGRSG